MKKYAKYIILLSILATPHFVVQAQQQRGYDAVGGEWLLVPLAVVLIALAGQVKLLWKVGINGYRREH